MPSLDTLSADAPALRVRDVSLQPTDDLKTRREKLARIVLDEMVQFVGLLDADGTVLEINRAALEGTGVKLEDIRGTPFWAGRWWGVSNEAHQVHRDLVLRASRGEFVRCDVELYGRGGGHETIALDYSLMPVKDHDGQVVFLIPEGRDITEKKRAEAEIARKNDELQGLLDKVRHLDELKSDLFANVSHELRTPLALILGPTEAILAAGDNLSDSQRRNLTVIHRNASTLLKHVNDLLDLAKFDAGQMTMAYARIDLARAVRRVAEHFHALVPQRKMTFVITTPDTTYAEVDPEKIDRVVVNLLSNAFKFTPDGGRIRCVLESLGRDRLLLSVQDSGPGVRSEMRAAIFDRFRQLQSGTTREHAGTGLGLAIAKEFVDLHAGAIGVSDAAEGGALFQVEIPRIAPAGAQVRQGEVLAGLGYGTTLADGAIRELQAVEVEAPRRARSADRPLLLVAEDDPEMRRFIVEVLGDDYNVVAAGDGEQALLHAIAEPPDLLVTDLMMPRMGGDQLVAEMRSRDALAQVPVLVLSAKADDALRAMLLDESVQDYVNKPFSAHELRARVRNLVTMKLARDALQTALASQNEDLSQLTQQLIANRQALAESEQRWRAVYESSAAGIALADTDGLILAANPAFQHMLGYAPYELQAVSLVQIAPEEERESTRARITRLVNGEVAEYHVQRRFQRKDGGFVWANASVSLIAGTQDRPPMLVLVAEDTTERKRAEQALAQAQAELARVARVTTMGELAASIAHEVNQPLAAIVANGHACQRWLAAEPPNEPEAHAAVQDIIRDANRASEVISRIRGFLRRGESQRGPVRVDEVIGDVIGLLQDQARNHRVWLRGEAAAGLPPALADRVQLQQVILNLVLNGIEAMSTGTGSSRLLHVSAGLDGADAVRVSVRDSGAGLGAPHSERIFDAFYTTKPQGMGMGLAISRSIIESHGGQLWAQTNTDGPGATFQFTVPIAAPDTP